MFHIISEEGDLIFNEDIEEYDRNLKKELLFHLNGFNLKQIIEEELQIVLKRTGYVLNQDWRFHSKEKVQLFFGITKLLSCQNPHIRRLIYTILQMTNFRKFIYIILQSLINDLSSNNLHLKQNALKYLPLLDDEIYMLQVDKYIRNALLDKNEYTSNQAILVVFRIQKKFPQIFNNWYSGIIIEKLTNGILKNKQHALNFVHEIKKTDINSFIKIIIELKSQELTPLVKIQLIRYIREMLIQKEFCQHKSELEQYLFKQIHYQEPLIFIETVKVIFKNPTYINQQLEPLIKIIFNQLDSVSNIEAFAVLKLIYQLLKNTERRKLIQEAHIIKVQNLMFSPHRSVSSYAIINCVKAQKNKNNKNIGEYFLEIYSNQEKQEQFNFQFGMLEFVHLFNKQGDQILKFIQQTLQYECSYELANIAFKITGQILIFQIFYMVDAIRTLYWIAQSFEKKHKQKTIKLTLKYWRKIPLKRKSTQSKFDELQKIIFNDCGEIFQPLQFKPLIILESKQLEI